MTHRLNRYRAGQCLDYRTVDPGDVAAAMVGQLGRAVDYRPVRTDGAACAAAMLAEVL